MCNPSIRPHLRFLPEDSGKELGEAYQAKRWLDEQDPDLLTPVQRVSGQDFFTLEPALLEDGRVCMPSRWFTRKGKVYAKAWLMKVVELEGDKSGWAVQTHNEIEISSTNLLLSFPELKGAHLNFNLMDPTKVIGRFHFTVSSLQISYFHAFDSRRRSSRRVCGMEKDRSYSWKSVAS